MVISLYLQVKLVVFSILAGMLTGFLFDLYRIFRGFENIHKIFIIIEDILFWILAAIIIFIFLLYTSYAFIGMYGYIYIAIGIYLYFKLLSRVLVAVQYKLIYVSSKLIRIILNIVIYPLRILFYSINSKNKRNFKRNHLNKT
jgi:spore cortex biosynthesis protein YabQ